MSYTQAQFEDAMRRTLNPSRLISYLDTSTPYQTGALTLDTWTKLLLPTTAKDLNYWAIVDIGGGDLRYQYQGSEAASFKATMSTGVSSDTLSTQIELGMSNGTIGVDEDTLESGMYAIVDAKTANDIIPAEVSGFFTVDPLDVIAVYVRSNSGGAKATFYGTSITIIEVN